MTPIVQIINANIHQSGQRILSAVNFSLHQGEMVWLVGKTGSGKSSLLKTIYGALPLEEGSASVAGFDLSKLNRKNIPDFRRKMGIIFQDFNLLEDRSVFDNLKFVLSATGWKDSQKIRLRVAEVLQDVQMPGMENKMPHTLSGGEKQRVVIARALLNQPELIIADEPTGNLDPDTADEIIKLMISLSISHRTAIIIATHNYQMINNYKAREYKCYNGILSEQTQY
ncbi:MAG: hypothetical protein RJA52_680 [Bacteroidota bacterium]|jgi:cell division transport system ATP-binding protein